MIFKYRVLVFKMDSREKLQLAYNVLITDFSDSTVSPSNNPSPLN